MKRYTVSQKQQVRAAFRRGTFTRDKYRCGEGEGMPDGYGGWDGRSLRGIEIVHVGLHRVAISRYVTDYV